MVKSSMHHYQVRLWLLEQKWQEYEDWIVGRESFETGIYEVWFTDLSKAVYFKLCFSI